MTLITKDESNREKLNINGTCKDREEISGCGALFHDSNGSR